MQAKYYYVKPTDTKTERYPPLSRTNRTIQMSIKTKCFSLLIALLATTSVAFAQNTGSNSPYGRFGFGVLSTPTFGASEQMGGISYGLRRSQQVNPGNPASYSAIDSMTFIFDFGVSGHRAQLNDGVNQRSFTNSNLDYIAILFPLLCGMGASVGLLPFSRVGYTFGGPRWVEGAAAGQFWGIHRGTGGLSEMYAGIAWSPISNFSVGMNVAYLFGSFTHTNTVIPAFAPTALTSHNSIHYSLRTLRYNFGVQQTFPLTNNRSITVGAVYTPQISTTSDVTETRGMFISDPFQNPWQSPVQVLPADTIRNASFQLPHSFGLGFTYSTANWLLGIDGEYQLWNGLNYPDALDGMTRDTRFNDAFRIASGFEFVRNPFSPQFLHRVRIRGGVSFANSYINVNVFDLNTIDPTTEQPLSLGTGSFRQYGANVGLGLPFHDFLTGRLSMVNIGFHYIRQQPNHQFMIAQDMFKISVNINFNESWFFQRLMH